MYRNVPTRGRLGQDDSNFSLPDLSLPDLSSITSPSVSLSVSPLLLAGGGLLLLALLLSGGKKAGGAIRRKGRALRKALKA